MMAANKMFRSLGGYLTDVYLMATCQLNNPHSYLKFLTIDRVRKMTKSLMCIETGTYLGDTSYRCARVFEKVFTIELDKVLADKAKTKLKICQNVKVIEGDATVELENIFASGSIKKAVVFLDGHYSGGITAHGDIAEPALQELGILGNYKEYINAIVIDDFRNFGTEDGHPLKSELIRTIEEKFPHPFFSLRIMNDMVVLIKDQKIM